MSITNNNYDANLAFLLNYTDGTLKSEVEHEIKKVAFQVKESVHYDRINGGSFEYIEQESQNDIMPIFMLLFSGNIVESIYRVNEARKYDPYIIVGSSDIKTVIEKSQVIVTVNYRLLKDLTKNGLVKMELNNG